MGRVLSVQTLSVLSFSIKVDLRRRKTVFDTLNPYRNTIVELRPEKHSKNSSQKYQRNLREFLCENCMTGWSYVRIR